MKQSSLLALGLAMCAACTAENLMGQEQAESSDNATEGTSMDGYTGRSYDAENLPPKLATGDLIHHGAASALVPATGESVYAEALRIGEPGDELSIEVDDDGTVHVDLENTDADSSGSTTETTGQGPCEDARHHVANFTWNTTLHYGFQASSTPDYLPVAFAEDAILKGGRNIVEANNSCGRADHVSASIHYDGRTSRGVNITRSHVCGKRDGHSVVAFGDFDTDLFGYTCVWKRKQYVAGSGATLHFGVESDIRLQKTRDFWWQGENCTGFGFDYIDLENVMTHERGHSFGLKHVHDSPALTMFPTAEYCEKSKRTLGLGDMIGLEILY